MMFLMCNLKELVRDHPLEPDLVALAETHISDLCCSGTPSKGSGTSYFTDCPRTPTSTVRCATCWQRGVRGRRPAGPALLSTRATTPTNSLPSAEPRERDRCCTPRRLSTSSSQEKIKPHDGATQIKEEPLKTSYMLNPGIRPLTGQSNRSKMCLCL